MIESSAGVFSGLNTRGRVNKAMCTRKVPGLEYENMIGL
jgi:hypothetical protein